MDLFPRSSVLMQEQIFAVDIAKSKQLMNMHGKKVHSPAIIDEQSIAIVIVGVPSHWGQISCQINENHSSVKQLIDICWLADPEPIVQSGTLES
jgi:hypothetical protein